MVPLELLALHAVIRSNVILLTPLLNAIGEERLVMWNSILAMIILPISFYFGSHWGTVGIAAVWVVVYPFVQFPLFSRAFKRLDLHASEYFGALWPAVSGCLAMGIAIAVLKYSSSERWPLYARLASEILVGILSYGLVLTLFHRNRLKGILQFVRVSGLGATSA